MANINNNFFGQLKSVCRGIEQGINQLQNEVETKTSSRSSGNAVMKLRNLKQEIQDMKVDGRQKSQLLDEEGKKFEQLLSCCQSLLDIQSHKLQNIEIFMKQYGYEDYTPKGKPEVEQIETECEDETKENIDPVTPPQDERPNKVKTPKPEDFGFSSYTLKAMERGFNTMHQDFITRAVARSQERIPSVFNQDDIVSLTPSVFGRHVPFHTPGKHQDASPSLHDLLTPHDKKGFRMEERNNRDFPKLNLGDDNFSSPEPPVFQTPGIKHLAQKGNIQSNMGPVSAFRSVQTTATNSPQIPIFQSESVKKLMEMNNRSVALETEPERKSSRARLYDDLPPTPEFTFNIKKLHEMSGLAMEPPPLKAEALDKEPTPPTFHYKDFDHTDSNMPKDFKPLAERIGHDATMNVTPPMPEMLSDRHSKITSCGKQQLRDLSKTPPTPKFLSKYVNDLVQNK